MKRLVFLGFGRYGQTVLDIAEQLRYDPIRILDDSIEGHELSNFKS